MHQLAFFVEVDLILLRVIFVFDGIVLRLARVRIQPILGSQAL